MYMATRGRKVRGVGRCQGVLLYHAVPVDSLLLNLELEWWPAKPRDFPVSALNGARMPGPHAYTRMLGMESHVDSDVLIYPILQVDTH